jgi:hypothetical protein
MWTRDVAKSSNTINEVLNEVKEALKELRHHSIQLMLHLSCLIKLGGVPSFPKRAATFPALEGSLKHPLLEYNSWKSSQHLNQEVTRQ